MNTKRPFIRQLATDIGLFFLMFNGLHLRDPEAPQPRLGFARWLAGVIGGRFFDWGYSDRDPLWRRFLSGLGLEIIDIAGWFCYRDPDAMVGPRDKFRWWLEGIGSRIFSWGFHGSLNEERMILDGEIPWHSVDEETRQRLAPRMSDDSSTEAFLDDIRHIDNCICNLMFLDHPAWRSLDPISQAKARAILNTARDSLDQLTVEWHDLRFPKYAVLALPAPQSEH